jgi:ABC-type multidrug transport system fused ATPase/permease subunit
MLFPTFRTLFTVPRRGAAQARALWNDLGDVIQPRRWLLAASLMLMAINRLSGLVLPYSTRVIVDDVITSQHPERLTGVVLGIVAATVVQGLSAFGQTQLLSQTGHAVVHDLRRKLQRHVGLLPLAYHDVNRSGALLSRIMSDVEAIRSLVGASLLDFVGGLLTMVGAMIVLLRISPFMTVVLAVLVVAYARCARWAFATMNPLMHDRSRLNAEVMGRLSESLTGIRVVKGYHAEAREAEAFSAGLDRTLAKVIATLRAASTLTLSSTLFIGLAGAGVWFFGTRAIFAGSLSVGQVMTFVAFLPLLINPVSHIASLGTQFTEVFAGLKRTREVLRERPEHDDPLRRVALGRIRGELRFEHVSFAYQGDRWVLHDINFHAAPGTVTAFVGASGAGKSTIVNLIAAFYTPRLGRILVDGVDLSTVRLDTYRTQLGVVLQDPFLFHGTIAENVKYARPEATDLEVIDACRIAHVDEFAERFDDKYQTVVGERGVSLSGGQRQRVSIARAILADPRLLILDEATSNVDSVSEALIQEGLKTLMKGRTTFVIGHRLSTVRCADQVLVVDLGRIVEVGTHESLWASGKRYWELHARERTMTPAS